MPDLLCCYDCGWTTEPDEPDPDQRYDDDPSTDITTFDAGEFYR